MSAALRREAKAAGAYWFSGDPQPEPLREAAIAKRMFQAFREITEDDDAYFYLMAPHCEAKDASAAWVADPALLRPENFAAFEVVLTRLKDFALPPRVNGGNHPSNGACHEQEILALG